jgi:hypothetical protein
VAEKLGGKIHRDEAYSKQMVLQRLGISQKFWDKMLDDGLPYTNVGSHALGDRAGIDRASFQKRRKEKFMKQIEKLDRRLLCRDGPRLEMSNSIPTDHCVEVGPQWIRP